MRYLMHFSSFGTTINSNKIVDAITNHGNPVFQTSEMHLKPYLCRESVCNLADIIAVYKQSERFYIVGIEIKEWDKRVHPKIAMEYMETYRGTCEYFYLAANKFSKSTLELKDIGFVRSEQDEGRQKFRIFVSRCGIQGEFDEENKKQLQ